MNLDALQFLLLKIQFTTARRARFYDKLASFLENGVPDIQALQTMHNIASHYGRKTKDLMPAVLADCIRATSAGQSLAIGLRRWVPEAEYMIIEAGQTTGINIVQSLRDAITVTESQSQIRSAILQSITTPAITLVAAVGLLVFNKIKVYPAFATLLPPERWTGLPAAMYTLSESIAVLAPVLAALVALAVAGYLYACPRLQGPFRARADRHFPFSLYRLMAGNAFLAALAALLRAGMNDVQALQAIRKRATPYLTERIDAISRHLRGGASNIGDAMRNAGQDFPDREIIEDLRVYAQLKGLSESIALIGKEWTKTSLDRLAAAANKNEAFAKIFLAAMIITFALGQILLQQQIAAVTGAQ